MHTQTHTLRSGTHVRPEVTCTSVWSQQNVRQGQGSQAQWQCSSEGQISLQRIKLKVRSSAFTTLKLVENPSMLDCKNLGIGFSYAISHANDNYFRAMKTQSARARSTFSKQNTSSSFIGHFSNQGKIVIRKSLYNSPGKLKIKGFFMGFFFFLVPCLPPL